MGTRRFPYLSNIFKGTRGFISDLMGTMSCKSCRPETQQRRESCWRDLENPVYTGMDSTGSVLKWAQLGVSLKTEPTSNQV